MPTEVTAKLVKSEQGIAISGSLMFATVTALLEQGKNTFKQHQGDSFVIDCTEVKRIDSAGIAALIEWQKQASKNNKVCRYEGLSNQAKSLIKAYRLQALIAA